MHRLFLICHRWLALASMIFIVALALSGSALVFEGAMDRGLHPALWRVTRGRALISLDSIVARVQADNPKTPVAALMLSPAPDRAYFAQVGAAQVFVDPYTGAVIGRRTVAEWNATLPRRLHVFHVTLMASKIGGEIVGIATIIALLLMLSGIYIWWREKIWRVRWTASWKRVNFDLHHSLGVFAALVLIVITLSGIAIHYQSVNRMMLKLDRSAPPEIPAQPRPIGAAQQISVDSLYHVATAALPDARVMFLQLSPRRDQPFVAAMRFSEDRTPGGRSRVYIDRYRGTVLLAVSTREAEAGTRLGNSVRSLHTGDILGKPTEAVWLLAAIILAVQAATGFLMWWNGRAARAMVARAEEGVA